MHGQQGPYTLAVICSRSHTDRSEIPIDVIIGYDIILTELSCPAKYRCIRRHTGERERM